MLSVFTKLGWFFRENQQRYMIAIVMLIIVGILEVIPPKLVGMAIDEINLGTLTSETLTTYLWQLTALTVAIYLINYVWTYQLFGGAFIVERSLRSKLMNHFLQMTPTFYEKNRTGDLMARATNDLKAISMTVGFGILTLVDSTFYLVTILFMMAVTISWKLTLAALLPFPLLALAISICGKMIHERFSKAQDAFAEMNDYVLESVSGVRVIRAYVQEKADEQRFDHVTDDVYQKNIAVSRVDSLIEPTVKILLGLSYMIGIGYGGYLVFQNELTLGELIAFNVYLWMMIWPMFAIGELINVMQRGNASLDRVQETLDYVPDVQDAEQTTPVKVPETIMFDRVTFRYPSSELDNLVDLSFVLRRGQTLGIVGRTGSGKSTILKQLLRQYPHGKGNISLAGVPLQAIPLDRLHEWMGYVPQEQILFSKTVRENIFFGNRQADEAQLMRALTLASFDKDIQYLPDGLETLVGEKGVALSGGQKQRVSLARALIADPEILLLDDAMSAVDAKTEAAIIQNIRRERAGKTTLVTTHRMSAVQHADWIIVLDEGRIVEEGTHQQLIERGGWYKEQFERQQVEAQLRESR